MMRALLFSLLFATLFFAGTALSEDTVPKSARTATSSPETKPDASANPDESKAPAETVPAPEQTPDGTATGVEPVNNIFPIIDSEVNSDPFMQEKKNKADEYFRRGVVLYEGEDFASAAEAFQVAYETLPHPAVLGNIAMCYDNAGKTPEAVTYYRKYFEDPVKSAKNDVMAERLKALNVLVSDLNISCTHLCEVRVDGIERGTTNAQVVVMPGKHRVEGVVDDEVVVSEVVSVDAKETKPITLEIEQQKQKADSSPPPVPVIVPVPVDNGKRLSPGFWFSSGMAVVSLSLVTAFGTMTVVKKDVYETSERKDDDAKERGERYKTITNAMIGLSGASAAAALLFALSDLGSKQKENRVKVQPATSTGAGVAISF